MVRNDQKLDEIRLSRVQSRAGRCEIDEGVGAGGRKRGGAWGRGESGEWALVLLLFHSTAVLISALLFGFITKVMLNFLWF